MELKNEEKDFELELYLMIKEALIEIKEKDGDILSRREYLNLKIERLIKLKKFLETGCNYFLKKDRNKADIRIISLLSGMNMDSAALQIVELADNSSFNQVLRSFYAFTGESGKINRQKNIKEDIVEQKRLVNKTFKKMRPHIMESGLTEETWFYQFERKNLRELMDNSKKKEVEPVPNRKVLILNEETLNCLPDRIYIR